MLRTTAPHRPPAVTRPGRQPTRGLLTALSHRADQHRPQREPDRRRAGRRRAGRRRAGRRRLRARDDPLAAGRGTLGRPNRPAHDHRARALRMRRRTAGDRGLRVAHLGGRRGCAARAGLRALRAPSQAIIGESGPEQHRVRAFSLFSAALAAGAMGAGLLAALLGRWDLRRLFATDAATCLACALLIRLALPRDRPEPPGEGQDDTAVRPLRDRALLSVLATGTAYALITNRRCTLPLALARQGLPAADAGLSFTAAAATTVLAQPLIRCPMRDPAHHARRTRPRPSLPGRGADRLRPHPHPAGAARLGRHEEPRRSPGHGPHPRARHRPRATRRKRPLPGHLRYRLGDRLDAHTRPRHPAARPRGDDRTVVGNGRALPTARRTAPSGDTGAGPVTATSRVKGAQVDQASGCTQPATLTNTGQDAGCATSRSHPESTPEGLPEPTTTVRKGVAARAPEVPKRGEQK